MSGFAPLTDTTTGRSSKWDATGSSAHVNLTTLISGENQTLNVLETIPANEYIAGAATTSGSPITIGSVGGAGDFFVVLRVRLDRCYEFTVVHAIGPLDVKPLVAAPDPRCLMPELLTAPPSRIFTILGAGAFGCLPAFIVNSLWLGHGNRYRTNLSDTTATHDRVPSPHDRAATAGPEALVRACVPNRLRVRDGVHADLKLRMVRFPALLADPDVHLLGLDRQLTEARQLRPESATIAVSKGVFSSRKLAAHG